MRSIRAQTVILALKMEVIDTCLENGSPAAADEKRDFIFEGRKIVYVLDQRGNIWIRSREIADILLFPNDEDITLRVNADEHAQFYSLNPNIIGGQEADEEIHSQTVFLSHGGIQILVLESENINKTNLTRWMNNVVVPSIRQLELKSKNEQLEKLKMAFEIVKAENSGLRSEMKAKILQLDEHINTARMEQRYVKFLREEKRASDVSLNLQLKDAEAMQRQIQILISESRNKRAQLEDQNIKIRNLELKIRVLETENQSKAAALEQGNMETKNLQHRIQDLEAVNRVKDETLEQQINKMENLQNDILDLKNENSMLNLRANEREVTAENYGEITRKQEVLLYLLRENFIPKPYDKKLENQFLIFALNADDFFPYYAVSIRSDDIDQQLKTIRIRHPNSVELLRIPYYPNAVNMLNLMKNHLKDKIGFRDNFFMFRDDQQYTDDDLKRDVLKLFNEAENTRQEVFRMTCIERDFRSTENKCSPTTIRKNEVDTENPVSVDETVAGEKGDDSSPELNPLPTDETGPAGEEEPPADETTAGEETAAVGVEGYSPPLTDEEEDSDSGSDLYENNIVHEANA